LSLGILLTCFLQTRSGALEEKDIQGVAYKFDDLKKDFTKTITSASNLFTGIKRDDIRDSLFNALGVLDDEKKLKEFKTKLS
jgi:hypothetical protein